MVGQSTSSIIVQISPVSYDLSGKTVKAVNSKGEELPIKLGKVVPVEFHFKGDPDFLTFYSGEAGKEYKYRERTTVDESEVETSTLKFRKRREDDRSLIA